MLASHGRTGPAGTLLGSTAAHLIEEVGAPMLVVRSEVKEEQFLRAPDTCPDLAEHGLVSLLPQRDSPCAGLGPARLPARRAHTALTGVAPRSMPPTQSGQHWVSACTTRPRLNIE